MNTTTPAVVVTRTVAIKVAPLFTMPASSAARIIAEKAMVAEVGRAVTIAYYAGIIA